MFKKLGFLFIICMLLILGVKLEAKALDPSSYPLQNQYHPEIHSHLF